MEGDGWELGGHGGHKLTKVAFEAGNNILKGRYIPCPLAYLFQERYISLSLASQVFVSHYFNFFLNLIQFGEFYTIVHIVWIFKGPTPMCYR